VAYACPKDAGVPAKTTTPPVEAQTTESLAEAEGLSAQTISGLMTALRKANPGMFEPEVIDGHDVEKAADNVMLDVAYSPVLEHRSDLRPVEVVALGGGRYRIYGKDAGGFEKVSDVLATDLKIMRARYLLRRGELLGALPYVDNETRQRVERTFWPKGDVPYIPPAGSPLAEMGLTGQPITMKRVDGAEVDFAALHRLLSTPGAQVPEVAPTLPRAECNDSVPLAEPPRPREYIW
jgi:hypothetical protein